MRLAWHMFQLPAELAFRFLLNLKNSARCRSAQRKGKPRREGPDAVVVEV